MKESIVTGETIYKEIVRLKTELSELETACDTVREEIGGGSVALKLLDKSLRETQIEVQRLLRLGYTPAPKPKSLEDYV